MADREQLIELARRIARERGIPEEHTGLFLGLIQHESQWNPRAKNPKSSARGLGQHLDSTARSMGYKVTNRDDDPRNDPETSLRMTADHLLEKVRGARGDWEKGVWRYGENKQAYWDKVLGEAQQYGWGMNRPLRSKNVPTAQNDPFHETIFGLSRKTQKASNCGDAVACAINAGSRRDLLPRGGLDASSVVQAARAVGAPVFRKDNLSLSALQPGVVLRYDRDPDHPDYKYGKDHAEVVARNPSTGKLAIASYSSPDRPMKWKTLDEGYIARLPGNVVAANLLSGSNQAAPVSQDIMAGGSIDEARQFMSVKPEGETERIMMSSGMPEETESKELSVWDFFKLRSAEAADIPFKSKFIPEILRRASGMRGQAPEEALTALEAKGVLPKGWGAYYKPEDLTEEGLKKSWMNPAVVDMDEVGEGVLYEAEQRIFAKAPYAEYPVVPKWPDINAKLPSQGVFDHWGVSESPAVAHARVEKVGSRMISIENQSDWQNLITAEAKEKRAAIDSAKLVKQWQEGTLPNDAIIVTPNTTPNMSSDLYMVEFPGTSIEPYGINAPWAKGLNPDQVRSRILSHTMDRIEGEVLRREKEFVGAEQLDKALEILQRPSAKVRIQPNETDDLEFLHIKGMDKPIAIDPDWDPGYGNWANLEPHELRLAAIEYLRDMRRQYASRNVSDLPPELRGGKWSQASWKAVLMQAAEDPTIKTVSFLDDATVDQVRGGGYLKTNDKKTVPLYDKRIQGEVKKWVKSQGGEVEELPVWEFKEYEQPKLHPKLMKDLVEQAMSEGPLKGMKPEEMGAASRRTLEDNLRRYIADAEKNIPKTATWLDVEMSDKLRSAIKAGMTLGLGGLAVAGAMGPKEAEAAPPPASQEPMSIDEVKNFMAGVGSEPPKPGGFEFGGFIGGDYQKNVQQSDPMAASIDDARQELGSVEAAKPELSLPVDIGLMLASGVAGAMTATAAASSGVGLAASPYLGTAVAGGTYQALKEALAGAGLIRTPEMFGQDMITPELRPLYRTAVESALWVTMEGMFKGAWRGNPTVQQWLRDKLPGALGEHAANLTGGIKGLVKEGDKVLGAPLRYMSEKFYRPYIGDPLWNQVTRIVDLRPWPRTWSDKTIREAFQPAIERLRKSDPVTAEIFEQGRQMRSQARQFGQELTAYMARLPAIDRAAVIRGLRGYGVPAHLDADLNRITEGLTSNTTGMYQHVFRNALEKELTFDAPYQMRNLKRYFEVYERRLNTQDPWKVLNAIITDNDPRIPMTLRRYALDLYNITADMPGKVAEASHLAMMSHLGDQLLNRAHIGSPGMVPGYVVSNWQPFRGLYVPRDVELELQALRHTPSMANSWYNKWFLPTFKTNKVVMRPAAWFRNTVSNAMLNDIGGLPIYRMDVYSDALRQLRKNGPDWRELKKMYPDMGNFTTNDVRELATHARFEDHIFDTALRWYNKIAAPARTGYNATESYFKLAKYIHNKQLGMTPVEAGRDAQATLFNYGEVTPWIQNARSHILGIPFATWSSKAIPFVAEQTVKHPFRAFKWWALANQMQGMAMDAVGMHDDEWKMFKQHMPSYMQGGLWLLMPWRDDEGNMKMVDLTWTIPGVGDIAEIVRRGGYNPITLISQSPVVGTMASLWTKHTETGAPLYYDWELPQVQAQKVLSHVWKMWAPAIAPGGFDWNRLSDSLKGVPGSLTPGEALGSQLGWKLTSVDPNRMLATSLAKRQLQTGEAQRLWRQELRKATSDDERNEINQKYIKTIRRLQGVAE